MTIRRSTGVWRRALSAAAVAGGLLAAAGVQAADETALAQKSGCLSCHRGLETRVGPPYRAVAEKYAGRADAVAVLTEHILNGTGPGGQGWMGQGKANLPFMPANAGVSPDQAARLAAWVLGIQGEITDFSVLVTDRLAVAGAVEQPLDLSLDALRLWPAEQIKEVSLKLRPADKNAVAERFRGVPLRTVLEKAKPLSRDHNEVKKIAIVARASDGYAVVFSWNELFNTPVGDGVLVYVERDGKPLGDEEGRIALISAQDLRPSGRHVKWLQAIEVRRVVD